MTGPDLDAGLRDPWPDGRPAWPGVVGGAGDAGAPANPEIGSAAREEHRLLVARLARTWTEVGREQLPSGEIRTFFRRPGMLEYRRVPLVSTLVHDALGCFDPASPWLDTQVLDWLSAFPARGLVAEVSKLRRRIRAFVAWQEECDGTWRYYGRNSGLGPDPCTTACAATSLLENAGHGRRRRFWRHREALARLRTPESCCRRESPAFEANRVENAEVLRFLALTGGAADETAELLLRDLDRDGPEGGSERYPETLHFFYVLARAWSQGCLPDRDGLRARLLPRILERRRPDDDYGGQLATALAASALIDLGAAEADVERARLALLRRIAAGAPGHEGFLHQGGGSRAWTCALSMAALARASVLAAEAGS